MKEPIWVLNETVQAIHSLLIAEHGGGSGVRDTALLDSALCRAKQRFTYEPKSSIFNIAAAYSFGIAKNHPFIDGNKRTAFTVGVLFLELNGYSLHASEPNAAVTFENLASGHFTENELEKWFEENSAKP